MSFNCYKKTSRNPNACYDVGNTFFHWRSLNDGDPQSNIVGMSTLCCSLFRGMLLLIDHEIDHRVPLTLSSRNRLQVRCRAPDVGDAEANGAPLPQLASPSSLPSATTLHPTSGAMARRPLFSAKLYPSMDPIPQHGLHVWAQ